MKLLLFQEEAHLNVLLGSEHSYIWLCFYKDKSKSHHFSELNLSCETHNSQQTNDLWQ